MVDVIIMVVIMMIFDGVGYRGCGGGIITAISSRLACSGLWWLVSIVFDEGAYHDDDDDDNDVEDGDDTDGDDDDRYGESGTGGNRWLAADCRHWFMWEKIIVILLIYWSIM